MLSCCCVWAASVPGGATLLSVFFLPTKSKGQPPARQCFYATQIKEIKAYGHSTVFIFFFVRFCCDKIFEELTHVLVFSLFFLVLSFCLLHSSSSSRCSVLCQAVQRCCLRVLSASCLQQPERTTSICACGLCVYRCMPTRQRTKADEGCKRLKPEFEAIATCIF